MDKNKTMNYLFGAIPAALIVFGSVTNMLTLIVCLRQKLRRLPTFVTLCFISVNDTLCLYSTAGNAVYRAFFGSYISHTSAFACKSFISFQCLFMYSSSWLLVSSTK